MLKRDLAPDLYYHSIDHTMDVYDTSKFLAEKESVTTADTRLLLLAALYHDSGYLHQRENHEDISCNIVRATLPGFNYAEADIDTICGIIMATKLPQQPHSLLEQIICDADLDYLGRDDFFEIGNRLYRELQAAGIIANEIDWDALQVQFLQNHHYFTATAQSLRNEKKQSHLNQLLSNNKI
ncbi:hypothetical protein FNO01nite_29270 [Flavobacterium noncentrifugens]|nr:hypothetical protein FNO01nite_29270 [Flavobacterium noncentrifugens]